MQSKDAAVHSRRARCRLCDSSELELVFKLRPTPPANEFVTADLRHFEQSVFPIDLHFCHTCFHVQLLDIVCPKKLFEHYVYVSGTSPTFVKHFEDYANSILELFDSQPHPRVLEIGSNDGTMLRFFKNHGLPVLGIDPATAIAKNATESGILTINDFFTASMALKIQQEYGLCEIIVANNVFAHIDDLNDVMEGIQTLLAKDGVFAFEVSYLGDVLEKNLFDTIYHEHLSYHSVISLKPFFEKYHLELFKVEKINSHGGSLRGLVKRRNSRHKPDDSVEKWIDQEKSLGLTNPDTFRRYHTKIQALKSELHSLLTKLKAEGKSIIGFGAPAKATTLMYEFELGHHILDFIVDDSPLKQGLLTPGLHIPVFPVSALYDTQPDYALVLAWNFADPIIKNHQEYLRKGGQFIIPIPHLSIRSTLNL